MDTKPKRSLAEVIGPRLGWRRSAAGNLTKVLADGCRVTIFRRDDGTYRRCWLNPDSGTSYDDGWWESEAEALESANAAIENW